jgi:glyoxylase-like metal-dependent hydrolase (beta-lactamase superfamily II)
LNLLFTPVTEEVFQVGGGSLTTPEDAAIYLIKHEGCGALVDAGCGRGTGKLFKNISDCGVQPQDIEYLLITHCHYDHTGGAQEVKDRTGCRIVAHELDARFLEEGDDRVTAAKWYGASMEPLHVDLKLTDKRSQIALGTMIIEALHVPGHSPGSLVYVTESEGKKVLFGQDVHGPLDASLLSNEKDYRESLKFLLSLEADILCEGHYGVFMGKEEVADFIQSFL